MAIERIASWGKIGVDSSEAKTISEVLKNSGLDYKVKKCPLFTTLSNKNIASSNAIGINHKVATVNESTGEVLGIVSPNYQVCDNMDAFEFVDAIDSDVRFVKAGQTYWGLVYVIAALPEVKILDDSFTPYVIFQNGHNGGITIKATISPLRMVCQNQFNIAFKESPNTISIKHNGTMQERLIEARNVLSHTADYMKTLTEKSEKYAGIKVSDAEISSIVEELFPIKSDMSQRTINRIENERIRFMTAYNADDNANFRNSMWGLVNAEADFLTHARPVRKNDNSDENQFYYVTLDPTFMTRFMEVISARVS